MNEEMKEALAAIQPKRVVYVAEGTQAGSCAVYWSRYFRKASDAKLAALEQVYDQHPGASWRFSTDENFDTLTWTHSLYGTVTVRSFPLE